MNRILNVVALASLSVAALLALPAVGCSRGAHTSVTLAGSTAFQPFAEKLAEHYMTTRPGVQVLVQGGGSAVGIQAALSGAADIGMADLIELPEEARTLTATTVARDGIAIVVHPSNPVKDLTRSQTHDVFTGRIANWQDLGGPDAEIRVISREEGSGTRHSFDTLVLGADSLAPGALFQNSNGTIREAVASDPNAVGYVSIGLISDGVRPEVYDGVQPTNENVKTGAYPLSRPILFLTRGKPAGPALDFIDYVLSPEAQATLEQEGLITAR